MPSRSSEWSSTAKTRMGLVFIPPRGPRRFLALTKEPKTGTAGGDCVRDGARDAQVHLRPGSFPAPNFDSGADLLGSLAHALQAPVPFTTRLHYFRIYYRSI